MRKLFITVVAFISGTAAVNAGTADCDTLLHAANVPHKIIRATTNGDVNNDGAVTIADVTALVNIILGNAQDTTPEGEDSIADINRDGNVTIADVTTLVNIILGKGNNDPDTPGISDDPPIDIGDDDLPVDARPRHHSDSWSE